MNNLLKYLLFLIIGIIICLLLNNYEKFACDDPFKDKIDNEQSDPIFLRDNTTAFSGQGIVPGIPNPHKCPYNQIDNARCTIQCNLGDNDNASWKKTQNETDKTMTCNTASTYILSGHGWWIENYSEDFSVPHNLQLFTYLFTCLLKYRDMSLMITGRGSTAANAEIDASQKLVMLDHYIYTNNLPEMYMLMAHTVATLSKEEVIHQSLSYILHNLINNIKYYIQKILSSNPICSTFISPPPPPVDETLKHFKNYGKPITKGKRFYNITLSSDFQNQNNNFLYIPLYYKEYIHYTGKMAPPEDMKLSYNSFVKQLRETYIGDIENKISGGPFGTEHAGIKQFNLYSGSDIMSSQINYLTDTSSASSLSYFVKVPPTQRVAPNINYSYPSSYTITLPDTVVTYIKEIWHRNFNALSSKFTSHSKWLVNMHQTKPSIWTHWEDRLPRPNNFKIPEYKLRKEWRDVNINTFPLLSLNCLLDNIYVNPKNDAIDSELLRDIFNIIVTEIITGSSNNPNPIYDIFIEGARNENWDETEMNEFFRTLHNIRIPQELRTPRTSEQTFPEYENRPTSQFKDFFIEMDLIGKSSIAGDAWVEQHDYFWELGKKRDYYGKPYIEKSDSLLGIDEEILFWGRLGYPKNMKEFIELYLPIYDPKAFTTIQINAQTGERVSQDVGGTIYHYLQYQLYLLPLIVLLKFKHYLDNQSDPHTKRKKMNLHLQQCIPIHEDKANNERNTPMNYNWDAEKTDGRVGPECEIQSCERPTDRELNENNIIMTNYDANNSKPKHKYTRYTKDANTGKITKNVTDKNADTIRISCKPGYINPSGPQYKTPTCEYENPNTGEPPKYNLMSCSKRRVYPGSPVYPVSPISPPTCELGQTLVDNTCR